MIKLLFTTMVLATVFITGCFSPLSFKAETQIGVEDIMQDIAKRSNDIFDYTQKSMSRNYYDKNIDIDRVDGAITIRYDHFSLDEVYGLISNYKVFCKSRGGDFQGEPLIRRISKGNDYIPYSNTTSLSCYTAKGDMIFLSAPTKDEQPIILMTKLLPPKKVKPAPEPIIKQVVVKAPEKEAPKQVAEKKKTDEKKPAEKKQDIKKVDSKPDNIKEDNKKAEIKKEDNKKVESKKVAEKQDEKKVVKKEVAKEAKKEEKKEVKKDNIKPAAVKDVKSNDNIIDITNGDSAQSYGFVGRYNDNSVTLAVARANNLSSVLTFTVVNESKKPIVTNEEELVGGVVLNDGTTYYTLRGDRPKIKGKGCDTSEGKVLINPHSVCTIIFNGVQYPGLDTTNIKDGVLKSSVGKFDIRSLSMSDYKAGRY